MCAPECSTSNWCRNAGVCALSVLVCVKKVLREDEGQATTNRFGYFFVACALWGRGGCCQTTAVVCFVDVTSA